jgi:hypothetical protein
MPGTINPPLVTAEAALNPALDGRLVQMEALLPDDFLSRRSADARAAKR